METESKYYTPTFEEFHIGFEYEYRDEDENWVKSVFPDRFVTGCEKWEPSFLVEVVYDGLTNAQDFRVKHLGREDIESLGWDFDHDSIQRYEYKDHIMHGFEEFGIWTIKAARDITKHKTDFLVYDTLFEGRIKNKSELKRLMAQLGII